MARRNRGITFPKTVAALAVAFGIGVGLCGLDYWLASKGIGKSTEEFSVGPLDNVSLAIMLFSAFGLVITTVAWVIAIIVGSFIPKNANAQKLFDSSDDEKK